MGQYFPQAPPDPRHSGLHHTQGWLMGTVAVLGLRVLPPPLLSRTRSSVSLARSLLQGTGFFLFPSMSEVTQSPFLKKREEHGQGCAGQLPVTQWSIENARREDAGTGSPSSRD